MRLLVVLEDFSSQSLYCFYSFECLLKFDTHWKSKSEIFVLLDILFCDIKTFTDRAQLWDWVSLQLRFIDFFRAVAIINATASPHTNTWKIKWKVTEVSKLVLFLLWALLMWKLRIIILACGEKIFLFLFSNIMIQKHDGITVAVHKMASWSYLQCVFLPFTSSQLWTVFFSCTFNMDCISGVTRRTQLLLTANTFLVL